jgi:hypothetical protein
MTHWKRGVNLDDEGFTLAELMVGMGLMVIFMAMFTGAVIMMSNGSSRADNLTATSSKLNDVFTRLDKSIRYASALSQPTASADSTGDYYTEFQTTNTGVSVCTQLQLNVRTQTLAQRTWTVLSSGSTTNPTGFSTIASGVSTSGTPFVLNPNGSVDFEQLTVNLTAAIGSSNATSSSSVTYTALNSNSASLVAETTPTQPSTICQEAGRP